MFSDKAVNLGIISIQYYALCIMTGAVVALYLSYLTWKKVGFKTSDLTDFFFNVLIIGVLGARAWYVLMKLPEYASEPLKVFAIWEGGLAIQGGVIAGIIYGFYYFNKRGYNPLDAADIILPNVLIAQAFGRWGNFFNQEAYGSAVSHEFLKSLYIPDFIVDKMFINNEYHHPTFLYESLHCLLAFFIIKLVIRKIRLKKGQAALLYGILYSFGRMFIEHLRTDSLMFMNIKMAQIISLITIALCIALFSYFNKTEPDNIIQEKRKINGN